MTPLEPVDKLIALADAYRELDKRLAGSRTAGGHTTPSSRAPIDLHVADVRETLALWIHYLARWLMTEVTVERYLGPPWDPPVIFEPWTPPTIDVAELAEYIARWRIGHFTHHPDDRLRLEFAADLDAMYALAKRTAWPSGARWVRLGVPCAQHCGGEYRMWMHPGQDMLGDLVCDVDPEHRITPAEWYTARRRARRRLDTDAVARLVLILRATRHADAA